MPNASPFRPGRRQMMIGAAVLPFAMRIGGVARAAAPDLARLAPITNGAAPIDATERLSRLARAQQLMRAAGIGAVLIEPGASLIYFTGVRWHLSERLTCAIIPAEGTPCIVTPFFEEPSVRLSLAVPAEVRTWDEDEDPLATVAGFLHDRRLAARPVGIEERVRFFVTDRLRRALPKLVPPGRFRRVPPAISVRSNRTTVELPRTGSTPDSLAQR